MYKNSTLILALFLLASNFVCSSVFAESQVSISANVLESITVIHTDNGTRDVTNGTRAVASTKVSLHDKNYEAYSVVF
jgi:citrate synthase